MYNSLILAVLSPFAPRNRQKNQKNSQAGIFISNLHPPDITCEDAMIALKVSHAALQSIEPGEAVEV